MDLLWLPGRESVVPEKGANFLPESGSFKKRRPAGARGDKKLGG